ncbi:DUF1996 domain-containing protein [Streptomyces sp. NPDC086787]|uniref:DUF1996 domain-containing protein n=1 Tax=Streptomyces sp. NPDC086787 TaxID=3365759 RepID=UPI0037FF8910
MLGGGGLIAANIYASASESGSDQSNGNRVLSGGAWTINCPDVGNRLTQVPEGARTEVDRQLAQLDQQIAAAYQQLQQSAQEQRQESWSADDSVMNPLKEKRSETIDRIGDAIDQAGDRPEGLDDQAACTLQPSGNQNQQNGDQNQGGGAQDQGQNQGGQDQGQNQGGQDQGGQGQNNGGQAGNGPVAADYADINSVQPNAQAPAPQAGASQGSFSSSCGVNANGLFNSDNVIVAPGVSNGAHHFHDYVGNQANNAFASDDDLANGKTTCADQGDKSTYYWPVLRLQNGKQERDAGAPGGGTEGNAGEIVTPKQVTLTFEGNPRGKVTAMPRLLRIITGDAKSFVNGPANANASWSCTGFEDRQLKDKYPICPDGSDVVRSFKFQSCWDGRNIDSANHRTHVAFADGEGNCPGGFQPIPQLVQRIVYDVKAPSLQDGGKTVPLFAVDSFPEQLHKPVTDHGDFINVFDENLMNQMVDCINSGRTCGAGAGSGDNGNAGNGGNDNAGNGGNDNAGNGGNDNAGNDNAGNGGNDNAGNGGNAGGDNNGAGDGNGGDTATEQPPADTPDAPVNEPAKGGSVNAPATEQPQVYAEQAKPETKPETKTRTQPAEIGEPARIPSTAANAPSAAAVQTEPQATGGGLAETGANLWPAALGGLLVIAGFVVLRRMGRGSA